MKHEHMNKHQDGERVYPHRCSWCKGTGAWIAGLGHCPGGTETNCGGCLGLGVVFRTEDGELIDEKGRQELEDGAP